MIDEIKKSCQKELVNERQKLEEQQKENQGLIQRLQRENIYLHNLVSSWKEEKNPVEIKK